MKTLMIASLAILLSSAATQAQADYAALKQDVQRTNKEDNATRKEKKEERKALRKLEGQQPSYQSREHFAGDFDNVSDVHWKRTKYFDEATFVKDGQKQTAFYDFKSELVGTTQVKTFADLPATAQQFINKKYKDCPVQKVILFDDNETNETDMLLYGHQFDDSDNYFVELRQGTKDIVLQVDMSGEVSFFTTMQ